MSLGSSRRDAALSLELSAVIVAVTKESPRILVVGDGSTLPSGPFDADGDRTLEAGLRRWVAEQTRADLGYVEQLYTFGDRFRTAGERAGGPRTISVGYLALAHEQAPERWRDWYEFLPWEDRRVDVPAPIGEAILPALGAWAAKAHGREAARRRERVDVAFGLAGGWDDELVLERYELMYEADLVPESGGAGVSPAAGAPMTGDHRRILATAMGRLRGKIKYRPVVFELLPAEFTLLELQRTVEALAGLRVHTANFRRLIEHGGLVEATGRFARRPRGRPAESFRFRRAVLLERPGPGVLQPSRPRTRS